MGRRFAARTPGTPALLAIVTVAIALGPCTSERLGAEPPAAVVRARAPVTAQAPATCTVRRRRFHSRPDLRPTGYCVTIARGARLAPGDVVLAPHPHPVPAPGERGGPMIFDGAGRLLYYRPFAGTVHDAKILRLDGRSYLAFWQRRPGAPNAYRLLDEHYRTVRLITAGNGYAVNNHDLQITPRGTAYVSAYPVVRVPGVGKVVDYVVQEIDLATGRVLFEWHSLEHVPLSRTYERQPRNGAPWDYFHGNSIEPPAPGDPTIIVSSRMTSAVYGISRTTGRIKWILGGKADQFGLARVPSRRFCAQHDARRAPGGDLTLFDNGGNALGDERGCPVHPARAMRLHLDARHHRVALVRTIPGTTSPAFVGSARLEPGGDMLISWGTDGRITEVGPDSRTKLLILLEHWSYRAVSAPWVGRPDGRPAIAARRRPGGLVDVWASWNGATLVRRWCLLAGDTRDSLAPVGRPTPFADLETRIGARTAARYLAVQALAGDGAVLGQSRTIAP